MSFSKHTAPTKDIKMPSFERCSVQELYASIETLNKESKKTNLLQTRGLSLKEALKLLTSSLKVMSFKDQTGMRKEEPYRFVPYSEHEPEKPQSMPDLLYHALLKGHITPEKQIFRSQRRLAKKGIPPPSHTFPHSLEINEKSSPWAAVQKMMQYTKVISKLIQATTTPEKLLLEDKAPIKYCSVNPGKQFMNLEDLEWKYFKGLVTWKRTTSTESFMKIKYDSEKRFVESQGVPTTIFPTLVRKTLVMYPKINYQDGHLNLKWNT